MNWPLVSRRAFDMILDERDRLRAQNDELVDSLQRVTRFRTGMPELPRTPRPEAQRPVTIPPDIMAIIDGFGSEANKRNLEIQVRGMHSDGTPFAEIKKALDAQMGEEVN